MQTIHLATSRPAVDIPSGVGVAATLSVELQLPIELETRELHLAWFGQNWEASAGASGDVRFRLRFFRAASMIQDLVFSPSGNTNGLAFPPFAVQMAPIGTPAWQYDTSQIAFTSGRSTVPVLDSLIWPVVNSGSLVTPSYLVTTAPVRFRMACDRMTVQAEPMGSAQWIPQAADAGNDGSFNLFVGMVSKA